MEVEEGRFSDGQVKILMTSLKSFCGQNFVAGEEVA